MFNKNLNNIKRKFWFPPKCYKGKHSNLNIFIHYLSIAISTFLKLSIWKDKTCIWKSSSELLLLSIAYKCTKQTQCIKSYDLSFSKVLTARFVENSKYFIAVENKINVRKNNSNVMDFPA